MYEVTDAGREALAAWLARPGAGDGPSLEFEAILRVMLAPLADDAVLLQVLRGARRDVAELLVDATAMSEAYAAGRGPFQAHAVHRALMHDFLCSFADLVDEWAERSIATVERWPQQSEAERLAQAIETYRSLPRRRRQATHPEPAERERGT